MPTAEMFELYNVLDTCFNKSEETLEGMENHIRTRAVQRLGEKEAGELLAEIGFTEKHMDRLFTVKEACALIGISRQGLDVAEKRGRLPPPRLKQSTDGRSIKAGYTLHEIVEIRQLLGKKPDPLPRSCVLSILNQKGGAQKTTTTLNLAQFLVLKGYKVLVIDTDPQSSLTCLLGLKPDVDFGVEKTMTPFLLQEDGYFEDEEGDFEEGYDPSMLSDLRYAVTKTYWPNLDIIPCTSDTMETDILAGIDKENIINKYCARTGRSVAAQHEMLKDGLEPLRADYDVILIDGTPSMSVSTVNIISASNEILVPTPAHMIDFASTKSFLGFVKRMVGQLLKNNSETRMPNMSFLITKFTNSSAAEVMEETIRYCFDPLVLNENINLSDAVREAGNDMLTVYEVSPGEKGYNKKLADAVKNYDAVFQEVLDRVICGRAALTSNLFPVSK